MYALIDIFNIYLLEFLIIMEKLQDVLKEKFDICYVLNLSDRKDRRNNMETQFKEMNFDNINESTWLRYHYTTKFPYNSLIASAFNESGKGRFTKANEYDCARNHYAIVKECYDRGFSNILVMEDDIKFLKNNETFLTFIHNIPVDYDILQFGGFTKIYQKNMMIIYIGQLIKMLHYGMLQCMHYLGKVCNIILHLWISFSGLQMDHYIKHR